METPAFRALRSPHLGARAQEERGRPEEASATTPTVNWDQPPRSRGSECRIQRNPWRIQRNSCLGEDGRVRQTSENDTVIQGAPLPPLALRAPWMRRWACTCCGLAGRFLSHRGWKCWCSLQGKEAWNCSRAVAVGAPTEQSARSLAATCEAHSLPCPADSHYGASWAVPAPHSRRLRRARAEELCAWALVTPPSGPTGS